jgi:glycosyltransferase involved in cell wall biosynthesis
MTAPPLSVTIITKNEGDRLGRCLVALQGLAEEIVVVDSGSTDDTIAIAQGLGARVEQHAWSGYGPQKRAAEDYAHSDWILNLDADEVATPALVQEIKALMSSGPPLKAYRFRIRNVYPGKDKPRWLADTHNYVRLYDKRAVRFRESAVHDTVDTKDEAVGQLKGTATHFSVRSWEHVKRKHDAYTTLQAQTLHKPKWWILLRLPFEYPATFLRYYIFRGHFTGGWDGIYTSHLASRARVMRLRKMLAARPAQA